MLSILKEVFKELNKYNYNYCHWKSNNNLYKSVNGGTDLDLLICKNDRQRFNKLLSKYNFKRMISPKEKTYPYIEDYLGFDSLSGKLIHFHVHYKIVTGVKFLKNHILPFNDYFFKESKSSNFTIKIPPPEMELIVLIIRIIIKYENSFKNLIKDRFYNRTNLSIAMLDEYEYLIKSIDKDTLNMFMNSMLSPNLKSGVVKFIELHSKNSLNRSNIIKIKKEINKDLKKFQRLSSFEANLNLIRNKITFKIRRKYGSINKRFFSDGKLISFVGSDGSGKSTIVNEIYSWLNWKLDVGKVYLGKQRTRLISINSKINSLIKILIRRPSISIQSLNMYLVAKERYNVYTNSIASLKSGKIIVSDRYPLKFFNYMGKPMDGPLIAKTFNKKSFIVQYLSEKEEKLYKKIDLPNILFVLDVSLDNAITRKEEHSDRIETIKNKIKAIGELKKSNLPHFLINSNNSIDNVSVEVKNLLWSSI